MDLQVTAYTDVPSVEAWAEEWQDLHTRSGDTNPFSAPDWPLTWLRRFADADRASPLVLAVRSGEQLVGVAPLMRRTAARGALRMVVPAGIGSPWVMPFELPTLLAASGKGRDVGREVVRHLCEHGDSWDVARLMLGGAAGWLEPEWVPDNSHAVLTRRLRADVVLPLDGDRDPYTGRRNLKESFRRARNRLTRDVGADGWSVACHRTPAAVAEALTRLVALHGGRAEMGNGAPVHSNAVADPAVVGYLTEVLDRQARRDLVRLYELRIGERVVASLLTLRTASATYSSLSGVAEEGWPYSAVTYLQSVAVADAREDGLRLAHLSIGPTQAKFRWTDDVEYHPEFWLVGPRLRSRAGYVAVEVASVFTGLREARSAHVERPSLRSRVSSAIGRSR